MKEFLAASRYHNVPGEVVFKDFGTWYRRIVNRLYHAPKIMQTIFTARAKQLSREVIFTGPCRHIKQPSELFLKEAK